MNRLHEAEMASDKEKGAQLLEEFAQNLPVLTRTYNQGGCKYHLHTLFTYSLGLP